MTLDKTNNKKHSLDFIRQIIADDLQSEKNDGRIVTRFPPEPNGYLHIGHAKAICLNFGIAEENKTGVCHLRFDDTNPCKEEDEYVEAIKEDVKWLGFDWGQNLFFASDYFSKLYEFAVELIKNGKAYVCDLSSDEIREYRGTLTEPGKTSPYRDRSIDENLELFEKMKNGDFEDGKRVLRAKIDMASPNINMRDPVIYRILHAFHHRTKDDWCIYPMYDFAHGLSDAIEGITHSICTLEFENHRPLYDWFIDNLNVPSRPRQYEFSRLNLDYTVMSKRKMLQLVEEGHVSGWDDPRMMTLSGLRRRGYSPEALRDFCRRVGVGRVENTVEMALLEHCLREDLNKKAPRAMAVLNPIKVIVDNYPEDKEEELDAVNNPEDTSAGSRKVPFSRELYIERDDFKEDPPKKFFRLSPGKEVRLRYAYFVKCVDVVKDEAGEVTEIHCTYDPESKGGNAPDGRKVKGTLHWVSVKYSFSAQVRLYDRLFSVPSPDSKKGGADFKTFLNPKSLEVLNNCYLEPSLKGTKPGSVCQFERLGYFCVDTKDSNDEQLVFNRTASLRDSWSKIDKKEALK